jgi:GWxTD domain-containing protein
VKSRKGTKMKRKITPLILVLFLILPASFGAEKKIKLPPKYKKWLEQEVVYIMTSKEEKAFKQLETDKLRDLFIEEFWRQRDPTPGTSRNEFREEHYRRIEYANKWFGRGTSKPGWKTERGRIYIILGEPIYRDQFHNSQYIYPTELWFYQGNVSQGLEPFFYIVFYKRWGSGDFILYSPQLDGPHSLVPLTSHELSPENRSFAARQKMASRTSDEAKGGAAYGIIKERVSYELAQASISLIPGGASISPTESDKLLGKVDTFPQKNVNDVYAYEFLEDKASVEVSCSVHYIGNTSEVRILQDKSGQFFVDYSIQPQSLSLSAYEDKYYSNIKISGRVSDSDGRTVFQYEREYPLEFGKEQIKQVKMIPMAIQDSFPLVPGIYNVSVLLQNTVSKEFTSFERDIIIPERVEAFWMGDLVLAYMKKKDLELLKSSFKVGEQRFYPCLRREFTPQDTLYLFFQLYGLTEELREEGWIHYAFFKEEKEQYVRKKKIEEYADAVNFFEEFSLKDFPPSIYSLRVSILDRDGKEVLLKEERFCVLSKIHARPWIQHKKYPGAGDPVYSFIRGAQFLNKGEMEKAEDELGKAYEMEPEREDFAIAYARVLLNREANEEVRRVLLPFVEKQVSDDNLYYVLGRAHQGMGEYEEAISFYQKFVSHQGVSFVVLNSIGECSFQIDNPEEALRAWEKSLEINPDQPEIKKKVKEIKKEQ